MHNGQVGIKKNVAEGDPVAEGITVGVGNLPMDKNPDQEQSINYETLQGKPYTKEPDSTPEKGAQKEQFAQIQPIDDVPLRQDPSQPTPNFVRNKKLANITITGGSIKLKDALAVQDIANDMLKSGDAAGFNNAIRDEDYGAVTATLKNSFGDRSVLEQQE